MHLSENMNPVEVINSVSGIILLVEDDDELRNVWETALTKMGFEVYQAANGLEALYQTQHYQPDLVVLDLMMPTASGDLVLGYIRSTSNLKDTPVLVVSAHHDVARLAEQYEADAYLQKPVTMDTFSQMIQRLIGLAS